MPPVTAGWRAAFALVGVASTISHFQHEAESNWIAENQPDIWAKTRYYVLLSGYLNQQLCGLWVDSTASQVGYVPFDFKRQRWAPAWDWKWQALSIDRAMLPELVVPGSVMGEITPEAAAATGIPAGLPLIAAAADKACEVIGAGCITPDVGCLSFGTSATINTTNAKYVETTAFIPPYPAAVPGAFS